MKKNIWPSLIVLFVLFLSINKVYGYSNEIGQGGHDSITKAAGVLKKEIHSSDDDFKQWISETIDSTKNRNTLDFFLTGAHDEDSTIPFDIPGTNIKKDPLYGPNPNTGGWLFHFYNPGTGLGWGGLLPVPNPRATPLTPPSVVGTLRPLGSMTSAPGKAGYYYERFVKDQFCPKGKFQKLPPTEKQKVYDYLGRIMHLIQDMSSPPHKRVERRTTVLCRTGLGRGTM